MRDLRANNSALHVAPGHRKVELELAALSFASSEDVHFRYRLTGFDRNWVATGTRSRKATCPRLLAGNIADP